MLLLTSNLSKYEPLADALAGMGISLHRPDFDLPELQDLCFDTVIAHKAKTAAERMGSPCLVDDAGLLLDAYPGFPGPLTGTIVRSLGAAGLARLLAGTTNRARMVCHIGCWADGRLWNWQGEAEGHLDLCRPPGAGPGPLTQWFVAESAEASDGCLHRRRALEALDRDIDSLRRNLGMRPADRAGSCPACNPQCVFCQEFHGLGRSIYQEILGQVLPLRIIGRTKRFLVFPPLGQFIEGGLLLATTAHHISMALLPNDYYEELERLITETCDLLERHYGCRPLLFEHAPAAPGDKGTCCVDHAHLNVFPARVDVHAHLNKFPYAEICPLSDLSSPQFRDRPYLFLQTNAGRRFVYDAGIVPSQYVRRIVTSELGMPERWHWREYLGLEELRRTFAKLSPWRCCHAAKP